MLPFKTRSNVTRQVLFFNLRFRPHFLPKSYCLSSNKLLKNILIILPYSCQLWIVKLASSILFLRADLQTFATKFTLLECIQRTLRQGGNADRAITIFFCMFLFKEQPSNFCYWLIFFSRYPCKLHTHSSSSNREYDKSHSAPSWEKQSSNLGHFCNIFQHFKFPFLINEEKKSLPLNACSPNKAHLPSSFNVKSLSHHLFLLLPEPYSINNYHLQFCNKAVARTLISGLQ